MHEQTPGAERAARAAYAQRVVDVLAEHFPDLQNPRTAMDVSISIERHLRSPDPTWEAFLDHPLVANWALRSDGAGRLRVVCRRHPSGEADVRRERELTALIQEGAV
ncbi:UNVERIFIED_ORG: hypothetical protein FHR35_009122 [Microbispora rosea subsp. rosea]